MLRLFAHFFKNNQVHYDDDSRLGYSRPEQRLAAFTRFLE